MIRQFEFLSDAEITLITERRNTAPWGLAGGKSGERGVNRLDGAELAAKVSMKVKKDQRLTVEIQERVVGGGV